MDAPLLALDPVAAPRPVAPGIGDRHLAKVRVEGSKPVVRSKKAQVRSGLGLTSCVLGTDVHPLSIHRVVCAPCRVRCASAGTPWHLRVFAGRDPVTGRKRWIAKTVHGGRRLAQREMANLIAEVDRGLTTCTEATVNDLIGRWLELASTDWSASMLVQTRSAVRTHITPLLGVDQAQEASDRRPRPVLRGAAQAAGTAGGHPVAGHTARPRNPPRRARAGGEVGLDRCQPGGCFDPVEDPLVS